MENHNGAAYYQNYDLIVKWMASVLRGETLDVLGVQTGRIEEVFGFEPVDIHVTAERVDIMLRDETGALFHLEEQRNLSKTDLYRFAAYHFLGAQQWGAHLTDIILASGEVFAGEKVIRTTSGTYAPIVLDFSVRDGVKRLAEIRAAVQAGTFTNWLELVFVPLYGKFTGQARSNLVEAALRFEADLYHAGQIPARLVAATLILSNKLIDKARLRDIWEAIKMLDILEIAKEEGIKEGRALGIEEGMQKGRDMGVLEATRELLIDNLIEAFSVIPVQLAEQIRKIQSVDVLKGLHRKAAKSKSLQEFEALLRQVE
jgi:hypothetical protein